MARSFGLGQKTGIDLEGESEGNVASEEYKRKVFNQDWYLGETFDAAIGQSYTLATPLQMAMIYASIANGGFRFQPYLVNRVDDLDGNPLKIFSPKKLGTLPVSKANLDVIRTRSAASWREAGQEETSSAPIRWHWPGSQGLRKQEDLIMGGLWPTGLMTNRRLSFLPCLNTADTG